MNLYSRALNEIKDEKNRYVSFQDYETAAIFRDMERFLIDCKSIDKFVEYIEKQKYYKIVYQLDILKKFIRKSKLEKLEKL